MFSVGQFYNHNHIQDKSDQFATDFYYDALPFQFQVWLAIYLSIGSLIKFIVLKPRKYQIVKSQL